MSFALSEANCLRAKGDSWEQYSHNVDQLWNYRNSSHLYSARRGVNIGGSWNIPTVPQQRHNLMDMAKLLWQRRDHCRPVCYRGWIYVYTNQEDLLDDLAQRSYIPAVKLKRAVISCPRDVILRRNPAHSLRTFLRARRYTEEQKTRLQNWLQAQSNIRVSPGLCHWLEQRWTWCRDYYWIDHDDAGTVLMLELMLAGSIGPTRQIMSINNTQDTRI